MGSFLPLGVAMAFAVMPAVGDVDCQGGSSASLAGQSPGIPCQNVDQQMGAFK